MNTKTITIVNNVDILAFADDSERLVPIRPICDALGIAFDTQRRKINNDDFLNSTITLRVSVGADGKEREMLCLPLEYLFGWLATINPKNVKPEAKEFVTKYRKECCRVLADHFLGAQDFLKQKQVVLDKENAILKKLKANFAIAKKEIKKVENNIDDTLKFTIEDWRENNQQLGFEFSEEFREDFEE